MSTAKSDIPFGSIARCVLTGYEGIVSERTDFLSGTIQYALQKRVKEDGELPAPIHIDVNTLEIIGIDQGVAARVTPPTEVVTVKLGDRVRDKVSGLEGTATMRCLYMNGCTLFAVVPRHNPNITEQTKMPDGTWLDHKRLEVLSEPAVSTPLPPVSEKTGQRPGGPSRRGATKPAM